MGFEMEALDRKAARDKVISYYQETVLDYKVILGLGVQEHLGLHYGFYERPGTTRSQAILNMNRRLADAAGLRPGMEVLDAGCGIGGSSFWLAQYLKAQVTGITLLESQCAWARRLASERGFEDRTRFEVRDYMQTGFPDASFDAVWGLESICYAPDKHEFLSEAKRVLRPGGVVAIADGFLTDLDRPYTAEERRILDGWFDGWAIQGLDTLDQFTASLERLGYTGIERIDITPNIEPFSEWMFQTAQKLSPLIRICHRLRLLSATQVGNGTAGMRQYEALRLGLWKYVIFRATREPRRGFTGATALPRHGPPHLQAGG